MKHAWFEDYVVSGQDHSTKRPWFNSDVPCRGWSWSNPFSKGLESALELWCVLHSVLAMGKSLLSWAKSPRSELHKASWRTRSTISMTFTRTCSNWWFRELTCLRCLGAWGHDATRRPSVQISWAGSNRLAMGCKRRSCHAGAFEKRFWYVLSLTQLKLLCWACACRLPVSVKHQQIIFAVAYIVAWGHGSTNLPPGCPSTGERMSTLALGTEAEGLTAKSLQKIVACLDVCMWFWFILSLTPSRCSRQPVPSSRTPQRVFKRAPFLVASFVCPSIATDCNTARRPPGRLFICNHLPTGLYDCKEHHMRHKQDELKWMHAMSLGWFVVSCLWPLQYQVRSGLLYVCVIDRSKLSHTQMKDERERERDRHRERRQTEAQEKTEIKEEPTLWEGVEKTMKTK